ncbi:hypothetical protein Tco_1402212 [Tanacetum coccineum]
MNVIKGHMQNINKPEGCIAEETITKETIKFFSEYHKSMETIGIPPDKHETYENEEGKPLSAGKSSEVSANSFESTFYIEKAKACMLAKAQASEASSKAKVEACGSKAKLQASTKTLIVKSPGRGSLEVDSDVNLLYDVMILIDISLDNSDNRRWATKKASALVFYGPSIQGLLDAYGCDTIEEYLEWNYFPSTDNESTNIETTDKGNTKKDCIDDSNSAIFLKLAHCISRGRKSHGLISISISTL